MITRRHRRQATLTVASLVAVVAVTTAVDAQPAAAVELPVNIDGFQDGFYVPIDDVVLGDAGDASVVANGNLAVTWVGSRLEPTFNEDDALTEFDSDLGLRGALTLELAADTTGDLDGSLEVLTVPLTPFEAGPVIVTPYLGIDVRFAGHADAGAELSLVAPFDVSAAISKLGGRPEANAETEPSYQPEIGLPDAATALAFHARVELDISLTFMMSLNTIPIGGPALVAALGAELDVNLDHTPWWNLDGTAGLRYGWATPDALGAPQLPDRLPSLFPLAHFNIDHADDDGPLSDVSTRWSRAFDIFHDDVAGAVLPIGDQLVVVEDAANPWMATLDGTGNPTRQLTDTQSSGSQAVARTGTGHLLVAGERGSGLRAGSFTAAGTQEWSKDVRVTDATGVDWSTITPTTDGAIIAGSVRRGTTAVERPTLVTLDNAGALESVTEIDPGPGAGDATIVDVAETPNGELLAVGNVDYQSPDRSIDQRNVLIMRLHPDGTPIASYVLGGTYYDDATGIAVQLDGSYAISGHSVVTLGHTNQPWIAAFDPADNLRWTATYGDRADAGYAQATGITTVAGGDYVVSGYTTVQYLKDAWMIRLDDTGMPVWSKSYRSADHDQLTGVVTVPSGVAAFGHTRTTDPTGGGFHDLWLVRTNLDGMLHFDPASGFDTVNGAVQWQHTTTHHVTALAPTATAPPVTITDAPTATTPAAAINLPLT